MIREQFPDFFLLGAPKCGTTSMFRWLQAHPDTYLPVKEPGFFSSDILDLRNQPAALRSELEYLKRICPPIAKGKMTGEATPKYLYSHTALTAITPHIGQVKLIVMLRNPVDLALAMHAQNLRQGREYEPDFVRAWERGPAKDGDLMTDYRFWGQPGKQLARWMDVFPSEDIHVLILEEEMKNAPSSAHAEVLSFLGLPPQRLNNYVSENPRKSFRSPYLQIASRQARRSVYRALEMVGIKPSGTGFLKILDKLNGNRPGYTTYSTGLRQELAATFADDVAEIARLLGRSYLPWSDFDWSGPDEAET